MLASKAYAKHDEKKIMANMKMNGRERNRITNDLIKTGHIYSSISNNNEDSSGNDDGGGGGSGDNNDDHDDANKHQLI